MKIRLEGTQKEINKFLDDLSHLDFPSEVRSVSKFYPNRNNNLNGSMLDYVKNSDLGKTGRVYIELE